MRDQAVRRIMTTQPATIAPGDPAADARRMLETGVIHHLPVVEAGKLVGILSTSDLLKLYLLDADLSGTATTVDQIMEPDPLVLKEQASLREAAEVLSVGGFHALPVVDDDRRLVGIVTSTDLIEHLLHQLPRGDGSVSEVSVSALQSRNRVLEQVCRAAELYLRSGHAEHEHTVLLKKLDQARTANDPVTL